MTDELLYEVVDSVAWITLNRPGSHNALNQAVRDALFAAFARFDTDDHAMVAVLTGAGEVAFCAGGDLKEMADTSLEVPPPDYLPRLGYNVQVAKPVIAAVNGFAFGGGFLLAQMCDLCVASTTATFGITEARWGRGAPWAAPLPRLVGPRMAMQLLLTAEPISAERAYEVGLVNEVVAPEDLRAAAGRMAQRIVANAPLSVRAGKALVDASAQYTLRDAYDAGDRLFEAAYRSEDALEGPRAFREKRRPVWKGR